MLNALKQNSWWLVMSLAGVSQQGALGPCAAAFVIITLLKAIARAICLSLPQLWRNWLCDQLASIRTRIIVRFRKRPSNSQDERTGRSRDRGRGLMA